MANIILQFTSPYLGDTKVYDDDSVETNGETNSNAVVTHNGNIVSVDLNNNGILDINPNPKLISVKYSKFTNSEGDETYRIILKELNKYVSPSEVKFNVYNDIYGDDISYSTDVFTYVDDTKEWVIDCPPSNLPDQNTLIIGAEFNGRKFSLNYIEPTTTLKVLTGGGEFLDLVIVDPDDPDQLEMIQY